MATRKAYSKCKSALILLLILLVPICAYAALTDQGNGTVLDDTNNLLWKKAVEGEKSWDDAVAEVAANTDLGYDNWRLPTLTELQTIMSSDYYPQIDPVFSTRDDPREWTLWSSDEIEDDDFVLWDRAYIVFLGDGTNRHVPKENNYNYRAVRVNTPPAAVGAILWDVASGDIMLWKDAGDTVIWE